MTRVRISDRADEAAAEMIAKAPLIEAGTAVQGSPVTSIAAINYR